MYVEEIMQHLIERVSINLNYAIALASKDAGYKNKQQTNIDEYLHGCAGEEWHNSTQPCVLIAAPHHLQTFY